MNFFEIIEFVGRVFGKKRRCVKIYLYFGQVDWFEFHKKNMHRLNSLDMS